MTYGDLFVTKSFIQKMSDKIECQVIKIHPSTIGWPFTVETGNKDVESLILLLFCDG